MGGGDTWDATDRLAAACVECGATYAAVELADGRIQPIGNRTGCTRCGGDEFRPVGDDRVAVSDPADDDDDDDD